MTLSKRAILPEYPDYVICSNGDILGKSGRILIPAQNNAGYCFVGLMINGQVINRYVHRLVAAAFLNLDIHDATTPVDHISMDKSDNSINNLEVVTTSVNNLRAKAYLSVNDTETHKQCRRCKIVKLKSNFSSATKTKDKLKSWCNDCGNEYSRQRRRGK